MSIQVCPFHADEGVFGVALDDAGALTYDCPRVKGHPTPGSYSWLYVPPPPDLGVNGLAAELGLDVELPRAIAEHRGHWVEYGIVERTYALQNPKDFAALVERYGHTSIAASRYTASSFLARTLGDLSRTAGVLFHRGPATGRWDYNSEISYWAVGEAPAWESRRTVKGEGLDCSYVPGSVE